MLGDLEHALAGHVAAPQDVFEKGHHIVGPLGAAERYQQDGVVRRRSGTSKGCVHLSSVQGDSSAGVLGAELVDLFPFR